MARPLSATGTVPGRRRTPAGPLRMTCAAGLLGAVLCGLAGCGAGNGRLPGVPEVSPPPPAPSGLPVYSPPAYSAPPLPSAATTPGGPPSFADDIATQCDGYPALSTIVTLLRSKDVIGAGGTPSAELGPLCAGDWQYTIVVADGHEPLQVLTRGAPAFLSLVTAGTYVCTIEVRSGAPAGILTAAHC